MELFKVLTKAELQKRLQKRLKKARKKVAASGYIVFVVYLLYGVWVKLLNVSASNCKKFSNGIIYHHVWSTSFMWTPEFLNLFCVLKADC